MKQILTLFFLFFAVTAFSQKVTFGSIRITNTARFDVFKVFIYENDILILSVILPPGKSAKVKSKSNKKYKDRFVNLTNIAKEEEKPLPNISGYPMMSTHSDGYFYIDYDQVIYIVLFEPQA